MGTPAAAHANAAPPPVRGMAAYEEEDNDDYKVFPPPGPETIIGSCGHGDRTIVLLTYDEVLRKLPDDLYAAAEQQEPVAVVEHDAAAQDDSGAVAASAPGGGVQGAAHVEVDEEDEFYDAHDDLAGQDGGKDKEGIGDGTPAR